MQTIVYWMCVVVMFARVKDRVNLIKELKLASVCYPGKKVLQVYFLQDKTLLLFDLVYSSIEIMKWPTPLCSISVPSAPL